MSSIPPSTEETAKAAATLAKSSAVIGLIKWTLAVVIPGLLGWLCGKLDTTKDILELRTSVQALTTQQADLVKRIGESVPALQARVTGVQRDVVVATGAAVAFETERNQRAKLSAGEELAKSFDGRVSQGMEPRLALSDVVHTVAVPHANR